MCLGKWNVLRPISLLDIKDVKPTPKRTWWKEEEKEEKSLLLPQKQTPALVLLLAYGRSKPKWNDRKEQETRERTERLIQVWWLCHLHYFLCQRYQKYWIDGQNYDCDRLREYGKNMKSANDNFSCFSWFWAKKLVNFRIKDKSTSISITVNYKKWVTTSWRWK